jgi:hypothetical protein
LAVLTVLGAAVKQSRAPLPDGISGFLMSPRGRAILQGSSHPFVQASVGGKSDAAIPEAVVLPADAPDPSPCGSAAGTRFNREPRTPPAALPQNETVVDFLPGAGVGGEDLVVGAASDFRGFFGGLGNSASGYYVHRGGSGTSPCAADFEGGLPAIRDASTGITLLGGGDQAIEADPVRGAFFLADNRFSGTASIIGLFRTTVATLNNTTACPAGTHTAAAAKTCWPASAAVEPTIAGGILVKPHLALDPRNTGPGAGDIYVSAVFSDLAGTHPVLAACRNDLSVCSNAVSLSTTDNAARSLHVRVRPDISTNPNGSVTVTYVNARDSGAPDFQPIFDIRYVTCTPQGAPNPPSCSAAVPVTSENQPIPGNGGGLGGGYLAAAQFLISTYPKHEHRVDANGVETYIVWDRCEVPNSPTVDVCPNAGIVMAGSNNNGASWKFGAVDTGPGDQYFPWIRTDSTNTLNIVYYSSRNDPSVHRAQVMLRQIAPGAVTPDPPAPAVVLTSVPMDPSGDYMLGGSFIGSNIGVAARSTASGRRAYVHFMHNVVNGNYNGAASPDQNNHLTRLDY